MRIFSKLGIAIAGVLAATAVGVSVLAIGAVNSHASANAQTQTADPGSQGATRLAKAKLKACQNREKTTNNVLGRIANHSQKKS